MYGAGLDHTCVGAIKHDPNFPVLHDCGSALQARFGPRVRPRQEEGGGELEGKVGCRHHRDSG